MHSLTLTCCKSCHNMGSFQDDNVNVTFLFQWKHVLMEHARAVNRTPGTEDPEKDRGGPCSYGAQVQASKRGICILEKFFRLTIISLLNNSIHYNILGPRAEGEVCCDSTKVASQRHSGRHSSFPAYQIFILLTHQST